MDRKSALCNSRGWRQARPPRTHSRDFARNHPNRLRSRRPSGFQSHKARCAGPHGNRVSTPAFSRFRKACGKSDPAGLLQRRPCFQCLRQTPAFQRLRQTSPPASLSTLPFRSPPDINAGCSTGSLATPAARDPILFRRSDGVTRRTAAGAGAPVRAQAVRTNASPVRPAAGIQEVQLRALPRTHHGH